MLWHPNAERIIADRSGGSYSGVSWRLVLHTTEGTSVAGAVAAYQQHGSWPHMTIDCRKRRVTQHFPFTVAARALKRPRGTVATNGANAIQVELIGYAKDTANWDAADVTWLGEVLAPVMDAYDIERRSPAFVGADVGGIASARSPYRFNDRDWLAFNGVCGHQHVPNNDHWDPGRFQIARFFAASITSPEEDDMARYDAIQHVDSKAIALIAPGFFKHVTAEEWALAKGKGWCGDYAPANPREWDLARALAYGGEEPEAARAAD